MTMDKMYVYIKLSIAATFVSFEKPLSEEEYNNIGSTWQDFLDNLWVPLSADQVAFHEEHPEASVNEVWDMQLNPVPERTLEDAKSEMIERIEEYDSSPNVNSFLINGVDAGWLTPAERSNYKSSIDAAKLLGLEKLSFFIGDNLLEVTPDQGEYMLAQIQIYADRCFIVTKQHKMAVGALETIEEVDGYYFAEGYPEKINFELPLLEAE